jgi:hypothetical protein
MEEWRYGCTHSYTLHSVEVNGQHHAALSYSRENCIPLPTHILLICQILICWSSMPMTARSKAWVCGYSVAGIASSNPAWVHECLSAVTVVIIIFIYCNWVVTRWQWLFDTNTKHEIGLLLNLRREGYMRSM